MDWPGRAGQNWTWRGVAWHGMDGTAGVFGVYTLEVWRLCLYFWLCVGRVFGIFGYYEVSRFIGSRCRCRGWVADIELPKESTRSRAHLRSLNGAGIVAFIHSSHSCPFILNNVCLQRILSRGRLTTELQSGDVMTQLPAPARKTLGWCCHPLLTIF
jgi:hypothetical protein